MTKKILTASTFGLAPERAARRNAVEASVMSVLDQYGYNEVALPLYEYYEVLKNITHNFKDENIISFTDRTNGKTLVLRPDFTPQVCRMVAGYKGQYPLPLRVYYRGTVFRNVDIDQGTRGEKYQIGCELYGTREIYGDLELLLCISRIMAKCGVENYRIIFGDAAYISRLLELLGDTAEEYRHILAEKALYKLKDFSKGFNTDLQTLLNALPLAFGGLKEINELIALSSFDKELKTRADYLREFFQSAAAHGIAADKIVYDPSEAKGLDYYTGINFEVLNTSSGTIIGGGGRYDKLMQKFNVDYTACGMALYLSEIEAADGENSAANDADWLLIGNDKMARAEELRNMGYKVIHLFDGDDVDKYLSALGISKQAGSEYKLQK